MLFDHAQRPVAQHIEDLLRGKLLRPLRQGAELDALLERGDADLEEFV